MRQADATTQHTLYDASMRFALLLLSAAFLPSLHAQTIQNVRASVVDAEQRHAALAQSDDPLLKKAIEELPRCTTSPDVAAPPQPMVIPHHYLNGSSGPTNPAEAEATRVYAEFERRITAGMNRYVATGSQAEAVCALAQLDAWAQAGALTNYDPRVSSQAWYQAEWTLSAAGITLSVLTQDQRLNPASISRVTLWLDHAAHVLLSHEKPEELGNNHHYWRALAAISIGIPAGDDKLYAYGIDVYKQAIGQFDKSGAFPLEMARHENAIHYQGFALEPLLTIAAFAQQQGVNLFAYSANGHTIRDAVVFFGKAVADPSLVKSYTTDEQKLGFGAGDFAAFNYYVANTGSEGLPPSIIEAIAQPTFSTRIGGSTTVLARKIAAPAE